MSMVSHFVGIDVGTGSARAGIFTAKGRMLAQASHPIHMWKPQADFVEQSSDDIWKACCLSMRAALKLAAIKPEQIGGIGFDATCSLVVLDADDRPVTVSPTGRDAQNVIVWMDHRAISQAELINKTKHPVLRYVGGVISPEMETPKLLWLKKSLPKTWRPGLFAVRFASGPIRVTRDWTARVGMPVIFAKSDWAIWPQKNSSESGNGYVRWANPWGTA
jgi:ribulose kinase